MRNLCWKCGKRNPISEDGRCGPCSRNWKVLFAAGLAIVAALVFLFALSPKGLLAQEGDNNCPASEVEIRDDLDARTGKSLYRVIGSDRRNLLEEMDGTILVFEGFSISENGCNVVAGIVLMREVGLNSDLFLIPLFGGEIQRLTQTEVGEINPEFDKDLRRIRYQLKNWTTQQYKLDLWADSLPLTEKQMLWLEWDRTPRVLSNSLVNYDRITGEQPETTEEAQEDEVVQQDGKLTRRVEALENFDANQRINANILKIQGVEEDVSTNRANIAEVRGLVEEFDPNQGFRDAVDLLVEQQTHIENLTRAKAEAENNAQDAWEIVEFKAVELKKLEDKVYDLEHDGFHVQWYWMLTLVILAVIGVCLLVWMFIEWLRYRN